MGSTKEPNQRAYRPKIRASPLTNGVGFEHVRCQLLKPCMARKVRVVSEELRRKRDTA